MAGTRIFADRYRTTARRASGSDPRRSESRQKPSAALVAAVCFVILSATASATQESVDALVSRAAAAREAGNLKDALALYRKGVEARPDWDEGRWYVATLLYEMDRYADAREAFVDVLRRQPTHAGALGLKGLCEFELRRYNRALADLLEAGSLGVSRSPGIATVVRYHTAILLTRFGDFEVANQMLTEFAAEGADTPQVIEAFGIERACVCRCCRPSLRPMPGSASGWPAAPATRWRRGRWTRPGRR